MLQQIYVSGVGVLPTKVVCLIQVVTADELQDDEEYEDIMEDMTVEARRYGISTSHHY
jgi:splicing factor U2AF subunit